MFKLHKSLGSILLGIALAGGIAFTAFAPQSAFAQATSGNISGTVVDSTGAVLVNAKVVVVNEATGVEYNATTNSNGEFNLQNLIPGKYNVTGSAAGFGSYGLKGLEVKLNETVNAKLTLAVAAQATSVEVTSEASVTLDTTTTQLLTTFEAKEINDLPVASVGLGVLNLSLLSPGVSSSGAVGAGTGPSVGGQRPRANNYTIEGIDNNNKSVTGPLVYIPADAVGDFTLITNQFSPEFGHSTGGQFNTNVKSGTNSLHGTAYLYNQNRNYNAENAIQGGKVPNPRFDFNRYGGTLGGPIWRNKLFFFGNYERQTTGQSGQYYLCTPTSAGIAALGAVANVSATNLGIYTKYMPVSPTHITNAADNACFNTPPPANVAGQPHSWTWPDSSSQYLTVFNDTLPDPNTGIFGGGSVETSVPTFVPLGNFLVSAPNFSNESILVTGFDYTLSSKDNLRGRYIYNTLASEDTAAYLPAFFLALPTKYHLIALSEYHNFTPNLINEARLGFNRFENSTPAGPQAFPGLAQFPNLTFFDQAGLNIGPDGNAPQSTIQNTYQFTDNVSWIKGKHSLKFGFDGRKFISPQSFTQRVRGDYQWNALTEYLHDLAPTAFGERSTGNFFYYGDQTAFYGYANDTWKASSKLTLNFGLRYEFTSIPFGQRAQILNAAASVPGLITFAKPEPQRNNYTPRFGVVYAPDENTSIRAGFGMAIDVLYDNLGILSFPPQYSSTTDVGSGSAGIANPGDPNFLATGGLPAGKGTLATFPDIASQRAATSAYVPNQKLPYAETWSLGVEHVFHKDYTLEVRYVGTRGIHLPAQIRLNKQSRVDATHFLPTYFSGAPSATELAALPNTQYSVSHLSNYVKPYLDAGFTSNLVSFQPVSESNYNGLAANLTRRFQKGLQLNLAYTWSKTMDDATADVFSTTLTPRRPEDFQNVSKDYSRSALDHTHRLTFEAVYDLPFFSKSNWLLKNIAGNWEIAPIYSYESPEYFTTLSGVDSNGNGDGAYIDRPIINPHGKDGVGTGVTKLYDLNRSVSGCGAEGAKCAKNLVAYQAADPNARYVQAASGAMSTAGRNTLPINPINNLDATAIKRITIAERYKMEFSAQAFNVLNHAQYIPGTIDNINSPGYTAGLPFQTVTSANFNTPGKAFNANARTMQLELKFSF